MPPVEPGREGLILLVFFIQYLAGLIGLFLAWQVLGILTFKDAALLTAPLIVMATANAILSVEGIDMLAEKYRRRRYQEGRQDTQKLWEEWNRRRMEAANNNQPFDEPPPTLDKE